MRGVEALIKINSNEEIKRIKYENEIVILYFSNKVCGACEAIRTKIEKIADNYPKIKSFEIDGEEQIEIAAKNEVFSFPVLILYVEGKETIRVGRNVDLMELEKNIKRYYEILFAEN